MDQVLSQWTSWLTNTFSANVCWYLAHFYSRSNSRSKKVRWSSSRIKRFNIRNAGDNALWPSSSTVVKICIQFFWSNKLAQCSLGPMKHASYFIVLFRGWEGLGKENTVNRKIIVFLQMPFSFENWASIFWFQKFAYLPMGHECKMLSTRCD